MTSLNLSLTRRVSCADDPDPYMCRRASTLPVFVQFAVATARSAQAHACIPFVDQASLTDAVAVGPSGGTAAHVEARFYGNADCSGPELGAKVADVVVASLDEEPWPLENDADALARVATTVALSARAPHHSEVGDAIRLAMRIEVAGGGTAPPLYATTRVEAGELESRPSACEPVSVDGALRSRLVEFNNTGTKTLIASVRLYVSPSCEGPSVALEAQALQVRVHESWLAQAVSFVMAVFSLLGGLWKWRRPRA
jgi:hypothetical protein